jgi:uncharacterized membrane protein
MKNIQMQENITGGILTIWSIIAIILMIVGSVYLSNEIDNKNVDKNKLVRAVRLLISGIVMVAIEVFIILFF